MGTCWWKFDPNQFCYLSCIKKPRNQFFCYIFVLLKDWITKFLLIPSFHQLSWTSEFGASKKRFLEKFRRKMKIELENVILNPHKISTVQSCFRDNQRWNSAFRCWFCCSEKLIFQRRFRDFQVMYSAESNETALASADNFWIRTDQRWNPLRPQPG